MLFEFYVYQIAFLMNNCYFSEIVHKIPLNILCLRYTENLLVQNIYTNFPYTNAVYICYNSIVNLNGSDVQYGYTET